MSNAFGFSFSHGDGVISVKLNERKELSIIECRVEALSSTDALMIGKYQFNIAASYFSFCYNVPVIISPVHVIDSRDSSETFSYTTPYHHVSMKDVPEEVSPFLDPVYALYRESKNSCSPAYRLFCLTKIMEGMFGIIGEQVRRLAIYHETEYQTRQSLIPNCEFIHSSL